MSNEEQVPADQGIPELESVLGGFSEEQLAAVRERVRQLVTKDTTVNQLATILIASRRIYALARLRLHELLEREEGCRWADGTEELIVQSMSAHAESPYNLGELMDATNGALLTFLVDELQRDQERQRTESLQRERDAEAHRLTTKIPLCLQSNEPQLVERGQIILLCGPRSKTDAVNGPLLPVMTHNKTLGNTPIYVVRLMAKAANMVFKKSEQQDRVMVDIGVNKWLDRCTSTDKFQETISGFSRLLAKPRCDLLVVEDVHSLSSNGATWHTKGDKSAEALKKLRRWAIDTKTVVLGYVYFEEDEVEERTKFVTKVQDHVDIYMI